MDDAKEIVIANVCMAIVLSTMALTHTILLVGSGNAIETNPIMKSVFEVNPALALLISPLVVISITYMAWRYHEYAGISASSLFVGFMAFDFWTHIYLMTV